MQTFPIAAAGLRPLWVLLPAVLVMLAVSALLVLSVRGSRSARFELGADGLRLRGDLYGRLIPRAELRVSEARRVTPSDTGLRASTRTLGTGLPGYRAGWFRLENGEKALLYVTDEARTVYVPTSAGYSVLLSPADPEAFLAALRLLNDPAPPSSRVVFPHEP
jgi:hypothetical protein